MHEGLSPCSGIGTVTMLLHFYNAIRQLDPSTQGVKLLDQLCQVFKDPLFLGTLPTENFSSHFHRVWELTSALNQIQISRAQCHSRNQSHRTKALLGKSLHGFPCLGLLVYLAIKPRMTFGLTSILAKMLDDIPQSSLVTWRPK